MYVYMYSRYAGYKKGGGGAYLSIYLFIYLSIHLFIEERVRAWNQMGRIHTVHTYAPHHQKKKGSIIE